jgi:hypothetical protein
LEFFFISFKSGVSWWGVYFEFFWPRNGIAI